MNGNTELLNFIYQNSQMGINTIKQLLNIVEEAEFKEQLQSQLNEYQQINSEAENFLNQNGDDEKGISSISKLKTYLMINMQTLTDKSSSHIAEMMIIGSNMGILDAIKNIKKYNEADAAIISLMENLLLFEENNVQKLKQFL